MIMIRWIYNFKPLKSRSSKLLIQFRIRIQMTISSNTVKNKKISKQKTCVKKWKIKKNIGIWGKKSPTKCKDLKFECLNGWRLKMASSKKNGRQGTPVTLSSIFYFQGDSLIDNYDSFVTIICLKFDVTDQLMFLKMFSFYTCYPNFNYHNILKLNWST